MEGVSLAYEKGYVHLQRDQNALLECNYKLDEGEAVASVSWYHDGHMILKWAPPEPPKGK